MMMMIEIPDQNHKSVYALYTPVHGFFSESLSVLLFSPRRSSSQRNGKHCSKANNVKRDDEEKPTKKVFSFLLCINFSSWLHFTKEGKYEFKFQYYVDELSRELFSRFLRGEK
ncbi:CLUMA_CG004639, isoform A [Clunio marinus]|uniref:CLUMA_CG004639, isoform A n=1 Tax=Clunio marinus TaxID=568069 RepID=A0A1J1HWP4_9DIPT|nr:CLUMA_CG004639, isoform A [Clunio marinus]